MSIEKYTERAALLLFAQANLLPLKIGWDGYPDRLVLHGVTGTFFWVEFKTPKGSLTPAQQIRFPILRALGHRIHIVVTLQELKEALENENQG
jgi:hypothetical protein